MVVVYRSRQSVFGAITAHYFTDGLGRRYTFVVAAVGFIFGIGVMIVSSSYGFLLVGRALVGLGVGIGLAVRNIINPGCFALARFVSIATHIRPPLCFNPIHAVVLVAHATHSDYNAQEDRLIRSTLRKFHRALIVVIWSRIRKLPLTWGLCWGLPVVYY
jgi:hypothetical protein